MKKFSPSQIILASFLIAILCAAFLLSLPMAVKGGKALSPIDSLFTATSATCVTGLVVKDTGSAFSLFGQIVILACMQLGGLGIMTFSTLFAVVLGQRLSISHNLTIKNSLGYDRIDDVKSLVKYIILITLGAEAIGAGLLYLRWSHITQWDSIYILKNSIFHSISAFCNAGFSLFANSLTDFRSDTIIMSIMMSLIIVGGLGFIVILSLPKLRFYVPFFRKRHRNKQLKNNSPYSFIRKINLQTKTVLLITVVLLLVGLAGVLLLENNYALKNLPIKEKILSAFFTAVTPRTAGFNVLPTEQLQAATKFFLMILMFIGASPGSTGGGIKTATVLILLAGFVSMLKGRNRIFFLGRTIERDIFRRSVAVFVLAITLIFISTLFLTVSEKAISGGTDYFLNLFFESTSAFGTCGLTTGITPSLSVLGKLIIIITMFVGRVGPLTVALALAMRPGDKVDYRYPEEKIMVG